jgi:hypothetical protein
VAPFTSTRPPKGETPMLKFLRNLLRKHSLAKDIDQSLSQRRQLRLKGYARHYKRGAA